MKNNDIYEQAHEIFSKGCEKCPFQKQCGDRELNPEQRCERFIIEMLKRKAV